MLVDITELGTIKLQLEVTWKYERRLLTHTHENKIKIWFETNQWGDDDDDNSEMLVFPLLW